jgi:ATP-binding cassette subfamily B (MDR/TAP) protein 6
MIEKENRMSSIVIDSLTNFETVKYFNGEKYELERLRQATLSYQQDEFKTNVSLSFLNLAQNFILVTGQLIGSLLIVYQISRGQAGIGDFVMFQTFFLNLAAPLNFFGTFYRIIQQSAIDMDKLVALLDQKPSVMEDPASAPLIPGPGEIIFDNVTFGYQPGVPTLKNVSFKALPGQKIALVGPTGSGKSSILRCLLRFYDIESGAIYVNGQDISKITLSSLRKAIGVVPQDMVLFNDTIRYNILYGDPEASLEQMEDAARRSKIHDRILSFPEGYDTLVGERGLRLSGGEKQRVAIARTILKNPSIVLLDEATSALDVSTEREIQSSLHSVTTGRTSISVAHRLTTIMNSDIILYIQDGNVMEQGTHEELLSKENGFYRTMWFKQLEEQSNPRTDSPAKK